MNELGHGFSRPRVLSKIMKDLSVHSVVAFVVAKVSQPQAGKHSEESTAGGVARIYRAIF
jgi:hypothetical protein